MGKSINGTGHMAPGTTWRVKEVSVLQGCRSSTCIYISWQKPHLCTQLISRTGWIPDALLCTMQLTHWDVYMKDTVMMGFILRRWLIGSPQCCPFHATLWKEEKITIKGDVEAPRRSMKYTFAVIYDLESVPRGREVDAARMALGLLTNSAGVLTWGGGKWKE